MEALATFLLWAALFFVMMRLGCGAHVTGHRGKHQQNRTDDGAADLRWVPPETDRDPVCGTDVRTDQAKPSVHDGLVYYFCSRECREMFEAAPESYIAPALASAEGHHG